MKNWTLYKVTWTVKNHHVAVGDYEGRVCVNYLEAPDAKTARKWFSKSELLWEIKSVAKMDRMQHLREMYGA